MTPWQWSLSSKKYPATFDAQELKHTVVLGTNMPAGFSRQVAVAEDPITWQLGGLQKSVESLIAPSCSCWNSCGRSDELTEDLLLVPQSVCNPGIPDLPQRGSNRRGSIRQPIGGISAPPTMPDSQQASECLCEDPLRMTLLESLHWKTTPSVDSTQGSTRSPSDNSSTRGFTTQEPSAVRGIRMCGFQRSELNAVFIERSGMRFEVSGRETYWTTLNDGYFLFFSEDTETWAIEKASRFALAKGGRSHGVAHSSQEFDIATSALPLLGWWEYDKETKEWIQNENAGAECRGSARKAVNSTSGTVTPTCSTSSKDTKWSL